MTSSCVKTWCAGNLRLRRDANTPFANEERAWSHMILRTKRNMADTWSEEVEARLITYWQKFTLMYDVVDKHYLSHGLKERTFWEIAED